MVGWKLKQWGAVIGALLVLITYFANIGVTALVVVFGLIGYLIGAFLDGEIDLEQIRARAQGRYPGGPGPGGPRGPQV